MKQINRDNTSIYPFKEKYKKMIFAKIYDKKDDIFNADYLNNILKEINDLDEIDLTLLLNLKANNYAKCLFFEQNFAWISLSNKGKQRYFTKRYLTYALDATDLLCIYFNCHYGQLEDYLMALGYSGSRRKLNDVKKYGKNKTDIKTLMDSNSGISYLLEDKIDIYNALNDIGIKNTLAFNEYENNPIFFVSTRFLKEKYNLKYSISTINQVINFYSLIGIIYKVPQDNMNNSLSKVYKDRAKNLKKAPISFYSIPPLFPIFNCLKDKIKQLSNTCINYYNQTKKVLNNIKDKISFTLPKITKVIGGGTKTVKANEIKVAKKSMSELFDICLSKYGMVAKEWIKDNFKNIMSDSVFNKRWKEITDGRKGRNVKPNNGMKEKYELTSNLEVFILAH